MLPYIVRRSHKNEHTRQLCPAWKLLKLHFDFRFHFNLFRWDFGRWRPIKWPFFTRNSINITVLFSSPSLAELSSLLFVLRNDVTTEMRVNNSNSFSHLGRQIDRIEICGGHWMKLNGNGQWFVSIHNLIKFYWQPLRHFIRSQFSLPNRAHIIIIIWQINDVQINSFSPLIFRLFESIDFRFPTTTMTMKSTIELIVKRLNRIRDSVIRFSHQFNRSASLCVMRKGD